MDKVIGQCSKCGCNVVMPTYFYSIRIPKPRCEKCGAQAVDTLPIIQTAYKTDKMNLLDSPYFNSQK